MIYLLDVAKIVTIPLIPKALGLPRAICYSGLHFGPCKIRYSEVENANVLLLAPAFSEGDAYFHCFGSLELLIFVY